MAVVELREKEIKIFASDGIKDDGRKDDSAVFAAMSVLARALDARGADGTSYGVKTKSGFVISCAKTVEQIIDAAKYAFNEHA